MLVGFSILTNLLLAKKTKVEDVTVNVSDYGNQTKIRLDFREKLLVTVEM